MELSPLGNRHPNRLLAFAKPVLTADFVRKAVHPTSWHGQFSHDWEEVLQCLPALEIADLIRTAGAAFYRALSQPHHVHAEPIVDRSCSAMRAGT